MLIEIFIFIYEISTALFVNNICEMKKFKSSDYVYIYMKYRFAIVESIVIYQIDHDLNW